MCERQGHRQIERDRERQKDRDVCVNVCVSVCACVSVCVDFEDNDQTVENRTVVTALNRAIKTLDVNNTSSIRNVNRTHCVHDHSSCDSQCSES